MNWKYLDNMQPFTGNAEIMILKRGRPTSPHCRPLMTTEMELRVTAFSYYRHDQYPRRNDFAVVSAIK
jgi:hypothetical protein